MSRVQDLPRTTASEKELVLTANPRMDKYVAKWLAHPEVIAVVHRQEADRGRIGKMAL
jgi:hypothetical protein